MNVNPPIPGEIFYDKEGNSHLITTVNPVTQDENGNYFTITSITYRPEKNIGIRWNNSRWEESNFQTDQEYPYAKSGQ